MRHKDIVFITNKKDEHTDHIIDYFNKNLPDISVIRLNTEDFATNCKITFDGNRTTIKILDSNKIIDSERVHTVVFRRPEDIDTKHIEDKYTQKFVTKQFNAFLRGFYFCTHDNALWINPLPALHRARIKLQQLQLANKIGFKVPKTMVTNNSNDLIEFLNKCNKVCVKSLDATSFSTDGYIYPIYTKIVDKNEIIKNRDSIEVSPSIFQEYIDKKYDIRVVVIGNSIFAVEIHSQEHPDSKIDFRGAIDKITHKPHKLPKDIEEKILKFVKEQGLIYSSMDLVLTNSNNYYFIENNPNGQWLWLEYDAKIDITSRYVEYLIEHK